MGRQPSGETWWTGPSYPETAQQQLKLAKLQREQNTADLMVKGLDSDFSSATSDYYVTSETVSLSYFIREEKTKISTKVSQDSKLIWCSGCYCWK